MSDKYFTTRRARVAKQLLAHAKAVIPTWLDGEIQGNEYVAINPLRDDSHTGSFKINIKTGVWKDFAVDDFAGADLVNLYAALHQLDESAALDVLEKQLEDSGLQHLPQATKSPHSGAVKVKVISAPAPSGCHLPPDLHPDLGEPSLTWEYKAAAGETAFLVYRFDTHKGKETRPVSFNPEKQDWQWKLPAPPLPLYQLDRLSRDTDTAVIVVEGEKAADAADTLFPDHLCTTSASGSSNALKTDWSPLYGREVTLVPDADEPGIKYAMTIAAELLVNGAAVFLIDTSALGWAAGDDVADHLDLDQAWLLERRVAIQDWTDFRDMDPLIVDAAARLSPLDYDRHKDGLVELLGGVNKRTLDSMVKQARQAHAEANEESDNQSSGPFGVEEPWPEIVDGKALITEIQGIIRSHVILSNHESLAVALWIMLTYVFRAFRVCPRLLVSSPEKRCGKTTLLETIQALCYRGLAAANITAASLFRGLEAWSPTLLIDEADTFLHGNDELRGILNSGHTRSSAYVIRTVGDEHEPKRFPTFGPIAIGMIKRPPDTLLDRSVVIRLQRKLGSDPVTPLPLEAENTYAPIRQKCLRWAKDNISELEGDKELTPSDIGNDRARDNWIPMTAIARRCGLLADAQAACRQLTLSEEGSLTVELLADIQQIFQEEGKQKLPSRTLVKKLCAMEERPWAEYQLGQPLTQNRLAQLMKEFNVHTHQAKVGAKNLKHYLLTDLQPIFDRYLKNNVAPGSLETTATPLPQSAKLDNTRDSQVADEVAVADSALEDSDMTKPTRQAEPDSSSEVADADTLPLPPDSPESPPGRDSQPGSGVAAQSGGKKFSFSGSSDQEGETS